MTLQCEVEANGNLKADGTEIVLCQFLLGSISHLTQPSDHSFLPNLFGNLFGQSFMKSATVDAMPWRAKLQKLMLNYFVFAFACRPLSQFPPSLLFWFLEGGDDLAQGSKWRSCAVFFFHCLCHSKPTHTRTTQVNHHTFKLTLHGQGQLKQIRILFEYLCMAPSCNPLVDCALQTRGHEWQSSCEQLSSSWRWPCNAKAMPRENKSQSGRDFSPSFMGRGVGTALNIKTKGG